MQNLFSSKLGNILYNKYFDIFVTNATQTGILPTNIDSSIAGAIFLIFIFYILDNDR